MKRIVIAAAAAVGIFIGGGLLYGEVVFRQGIAEEERPRGQKLTSYDFETVRTRNIAVFPLTFQDSTAQQLETLPTAKQLQTVMFDKSSAVAKYLDSQSFGQFTMTGKVFEPIALAENFIQPDGSPKWIQGFDSIELPINLDLGSYDTIIFVPMTAAGTLSTAVVFDGPTTGFAINGDAVPSNLGLMWLPIDVSDSINNFKETWVGWTNAQVDEFKEGTWISPLTQFERTFIHELVHDLGVFGHANSRTGDGVPYWQADNLAEEWDVEYGNNFDIMGNSSSAQGLSSFFKHRLGWISDRVITILEGASQRVQLEPNDSPTGFIGVQIINKGVFNQWTFRQDADYTETGYWIEVLPRKSPYSSNLDFVSSNADGLIIHVTDGISPLLLDASPGPTRKYDWGKIADLSDVVLRPGESFSDGVIEITNVQASEEGTVSFLISKLE